MAVKSIHNQYLGINAHLHSLLQAQGGWGDFHARHIVHLADALTARLRPMGYLAKVEESLQIRHIDEPFQHRRADVLVYDTHPPQPAGRASQSARLADPPSDKPLRAVAIYPVSRRDTPVVWIELLSPTNKGASEDADAYRAKRMTLLVGGMVFIELDYLHETPPTLPTIRPYMASNGHPYRLDERHPYRILIIDPRPQLEAGWGNVHGFDVDVPLPVLDIPLKEKEALSAFDFGAPYQKTDADGAMGSDVDYAQLPLNFDRYSPDDQVRITRRMLAVCEAAARGDDLEAPPFPIDETLTLDDTLARLAEHQPRS
jgi:hypothetical protein